MPRREADSTPGWGSSRLPWTTRPLVVKACLPMRISRSSTASASTKVSLSTSMPFRLIFSTRNEAW